MVRQTATVITLELIGGILLVAIAAVVILAVMLASGPVELNVFKADVESALEEARDGRAVDIERLTLQWSPSDRRMIVAAEHLKLADDAGEIVGEAEQAVITLDAGSLFLGKPEVLRTDLRNGWAEVRNVSPTLWTFAGEPLPEFEARELPDTPDGWLQLSNRVLGQVLSGLERERRTGSLESASFQNMSLTFKDKEGSTLGEMGAAEGAFARVDGGLAVTLAGSGTGLGLPGDIEAGLNIPEAYDSLRVNVGIENWSVGDLATRLGLREGRVTGFPADIGLGLTYEPAGGITLMALSADAEAGVIEAAGRSFNFETLAFSTSFDPQADRLEIERIAYATDQTSGEWRGSVSNAVGGSEAIEFDLQADAIALDFTPYFPEAWSLSDVVLRGTVPVSFDLVSVNEFSFDIGGAVLSGTADIAPPQEGQTGAFPANLNIKGEIDGELSKELVLSYWPETLGAGARRFAVNRVKSGRATAANVTLALKPDSFEEGFLRDEDLEVRFFVEDAEVKFLDDLPPVTEGVGSGRLTGNGFSVQLSSGEYGGWQLSEGAVQFPKFNPKGELFRVYAKGSGPVADAMRNIADSRLMADAETELDPERFFGEAEASFEMFRPALDDVPMEDIDIKVSGTIKNGGVRKALPGLDLVDAEAELDLSDNRLVVTGFGDLGPAPVQFTWRDQLDDDGSPADLSASAFISPDFLNRYGIVGRAYVSEDIPVELQAKVAAEGVETVEIGFELQQSRIDVSEMGWIKPSGQPARATLSYDAVQGATASTFVFKSQDARFDGDIDLAPDGQLQSLNVREIYLADFIDASGEIVRTENQGLQSKLDGAFLDASAFFGDFGSVGGGGISIPLSLTARLDTLRLRQGLDLKNANLDFESTRAGVREVHARGAIGSGGGTIDAVYRGPTASNAANVRLESDDAGFFMRGMLGQDFLSGGRLLLFGDLSRGDEPARLRLSLDNVRMREAPFLTQVLSLASLRGLADTLSGDGVLFTHIEVPLTIAGDRFIVEGARANGPALGLTMNGWFEQGTDEIRLSGVLVPSFGMNSMLGGVPIIGDLFVGREGEGIFSLTYSVRGTTNKAQVTVNPLSAVTPGILRRIFENPADTSIPDSLPVDPDRTPPAPPMPDAEFIPSAPGSN